MRKTGNGLPKKGNSLHLGKHTNPDVDYQSQLAAALRKELGGSHQAVKTLMRWTGASERTAKNWLSGSAGPNGVHLIQLMSVSDAVFEAVLKLSKRRPDLPSERLASARLLIEKAITFLG